MLAVEETAAGGGSSHSYWFFYDANGNVGQLIRASDRSLAARYEYDPYGNTIVATGPDGGVLARANPFRFSTKHYDAELDDRGTPAAEGLYYYGYRYYSPRLGRWLNRDPVNESGGVTVIKLYFRRQSEAAQTSPAGSDVRATSLPSGAAGGTERAYGFCANAPVMRTDVLGLDEICGPGCFYVPLDGGCICIGEPPPPPPPPRPPRIRPPSLPWWARGNFRLTVAETDRLCQVIGGVGAGAAGAAVVCPMLWHRRALVRSDCVPRGSCRRPSSVPPSAGHDSVGRECDQAPAMPATRLEAVVFQVVRPRMGADRGVPYVDPCLDVADIGAQIHDAALDLERIYYGESAEMLTLVFWQEDTSREAVRVTRVMLFWERVRYPRREVILTLGKVKSWRVVGDGRVRYPIVVDVRWDNQKRLLVFDTAGLADVLVVVPSRHLSSTRGGNHLTISGYRRFGGRRARRMGLDRGT